MASGVPTSPIADAMVDQIDLLGEMKLVDSDDGGDTPGVKNWRTRVTRQGPWDQERTPEMLAGSPSLPMPVEIAQPPTLAPFFHHLENGGNHTFLPGESEKEFPGAARPVLGKEPYYGVPFIEYGKGVVYADRRLDLCKMVVGPLNIESLMDSLENNTFIIHFLLGNNIIGPTGARRIAKFIQDHPKRMDTWYLAGNCIDAPGFKKMVDGLVKSVTTNLWLKRNPLTADAVPDIARLIQQSTCLRTLDLDQTEIGDEGIAQLFDILSTSESKSCSLQHIYINACGIGSKGVASIGRFLKSRACRLQSLFLSNNPIGDDGVAALGEGLKYSTTIERVMLASIGLTSKGATELLEQLTGHETLVSLDLGQSYATEDLNGRFNWITDDAVPAIKTFIHSTLRLRYFVLDYTNISQMGINEIHAIGVLNSKSMCWFVVKTIQPSGDKTVLRAKREKKSLQPLVRERLHRNVAELYNGMSYQDFDASERRKLTSPEEDVRKIDSVYRNRDAGLARRGLKVLDKWWKEDDNTLKEVMAS